MIILPAVDLIGGKAVRLYQGDYDKVTVYDDDPLSAVRRFEEAGAQWLHLVDLEGAKSGASENAETVKRIVKNTSLKVELGGGVRSMDSIRRWIDAGVSRVVLGTAAVKDPELPAMAAEEFGAAVAVGVDVRGGFVSVSGWTEVTDIPCLDFCRQMQHAGIRTVICTDVSRDGAMRGVNLDLYKELDRELSVNIIASGGVSSMEDVAALSRLDLYGAIIGKAYYTGAIDLAQAISAGKDGRL